MGDTVAADDPCVSCRTSSYTIQQLARLGLPVEHLADGTGYTLDELRQPAAFIPWGAYLTFFENAHRGVTPEQYVALCTSYDTSPYLRPLLAASGLWFDPARYFEWVAAPAGALQQLFRCLDTRFERVGPREVVVEERLRPGFVPPPDLFWECQAIGFSALTAHFGLGPSVVTWERTEGGAAFRARLPRRRPVRQLLAKVAAWFRPGAPDELRAALLYGHERSLRLEREVDARNRAEAAHRASEERLRRITDAVPGIVYQYYLDPDGRQGHTFISDGAAALTGFTPAELIADPGHLWRMVLPEFHAVFAASVAASARDGTPWHLDFPFRTRSGELKWVRGHSVPEPPDPSGRVVWNGLLTDVTEQKRAEAALRERDEQFQKLSEQVPGVIYQYRQWPDGRSCFPYASEGIRAVYEVAPGEVRESAAAVFARLHPDDLGRVAASIARSVETLAEWRCEYRVRLPARGERWLEGHAAPERLPDGSTLWHGHISDITDRVRVSAALAARERELQAMADNVPIILTRFDRQFRHLFVNAAVERAAGRPVADFIGKTNRDLGMPPDLCDLWDGLLRTVFDTGRPHEGEFTFPTPGGPRHYELKLVPEFDPDGAVATAFGVTHDVTEWRRAEAALRASEERYRLASEAFQGLLYDLDLVTGAVYRSAGMTDLLGYAADEVPAGPDGWARLLHPDDRDRVLAEVAAALAAGDRVDLEYRLRHRDGHYVDVWDRGQIVRGPDGAPVRIVGSTLDQTTRRRAEAALRESEERLSAVVRYTPNVAIQWFDADGRVVLWNEASERLFGFPSAAAVGKTLDQLIHTPEETAAFRAVLAEVGRTGRPAGPAEYHFRRADGADRVCLSSLFRIPGGAGADWFVCMDVDITDRKRAEGELRASRDRLRLAQAILDAVGDSIVVTEAEPVGEPGPRIVYANPALLRSSGYALGEVLGRTPRMFQGPGTDPAARARIRAALTAWEPVRAEVLNYRKDGSEFWVELDISPLADETGWFTHWISVQRDVTERKRGEAALRESEARYRTMFDANPHPMWVYDLDTLAFLAVNDAAVAKYGYARDEFLRMTIKDIRPPEDVPALLGRVPGPGHEFDDAGVWRHRLKDGRPIRVRISSHTLTFADRPAEVVLAQDVTDQLRAEEALRESEERFRTLIDDLDVGVVLQDAADRVLVANPAAARVLGLTPDQLSGVTSRDPRWKLVRADGSDLPAAEVPSVAASRTGRPVRDALVGATNLQTGGRIWLQVSASPRRTPEGALAHVLVTLVDVTERVRADAALRESEERFRALVETSPDAIFLLDLTGHIRSANASAARMHGWSPGEIAAMRIQDLDTPDTARLAAGRLGRVLAGEVLTFEATHRRRDGTEFPVEVVAGRVDLGGEALVLALDRDITDRKRAEDALRESEALLRQTFEHSAIGVALVGTDRRFQRVNPALCRILGYTEAELLGRDSELTTDPEDRAADREWTDALLSGRRDAATVEKRYLRADGSRVWGQLTVSLIRDAAGRPKYFVSLIQDVSARRAAEAARREIEERLQVALSAAAAVGFVWDAATDSVVRYFSTEPALPANPSAPEPVARVRAAVHPDDRAAFDAGVAACLAAGPEYRNLYRVVRPDGTARWLEEWGTLIRDASGRPDRLIGVSIDVTDRKRAEEALREAEYRQRLALDAGRMGTWDWEIGTEQLVWDASEEALFGFPPGGFDGRLTTFLDRVHPDDRAAVRQVLTDAAAGKDFEGAFRITRPDGEVRWVHGAGAVRPAGEGRPARLIGINYDVTARVQAEERLRDSVREKEAMLKEIHHRVKNNLQVISSLLNLQAERIADPDARAVFRESQSRVRAMALVHETLYGSESLARIELPRYLERLCDSLLQTYGRAERVAIARAVEPVALDLDRAIPVGLIAGELVSNALKYAFPGGRAGQIRVSVAAREGVNYSLTVSDDGVGLPPDLNLDRATTLGLYLVRVLTQQLRGTLEVGPSGGGGATFTVRFPA